MVYRARKSSTQFKVHLYLTKTNLDLIKRANEMITENEDIFAFADVNCRLFIKLGYEVQKFSDRREVFIYWESFSVRNYCRRFRD